MWNGALKTVLEGLAYLRKLCCQIPAREKLLYLKIKANNLLVFIDVIILYQNISVFIDKEVVHDALTFLMVLCLLTLSYLLIRMLYRQDLFSD